jgi:hypothetical protein
MKCSMNSETKQIWSPKKNVGPWFQCHKERSNRILPNAPPWEGLCTMNKDKIETKNENIPPCLQLCKKQTKWH